MNSSAAEFRSREKNILHSEKQQQIGREPFMIKLKNIFMYITLIWSAVMLALYLIVLFEIPLFMLIGYLPLGEEIGQFLSGLLFLGIWAVPALYILTLTFMIVARIKFKEKNQKKRIAVPTVILPLVLAAVMLLTNFIEILSSAKNAF